MTRYENRVQLAMALVVGLLLLANLFTLTLVALMPTERGMRAPVLFSVFFVTLLVSLPAVFMLPRWLLKPYRQLVGEAERAPVEAKNETQRDETEFVLETFQAVVAQLREQQRELEALSARASERAASAEMFSERIVASVPSGLVAFDAEGRATVVNAPARALLSADGAAEGRGYSELLARAPKLARLVESCLGEGQLFRREEVASVSSDGRARRLGVTVAPIDPQPGSHARGALCLLTDITEVAELREALATKRNLESLGEMSAGLAHEFKNALAALHGYAQLLQTVAQDERSRAGATALLEEVRGLSAMVTSFLNFARPQPLELADVSARELIDDCARELDGLFKERRVELIIDGEFATVRGDERMLRQAILNLMRNAAEAIGDGDAQRRVTLSGARELDAAGEGWLVVRVADTGSGVEAADLGRIFIPFYTTKSGGHGVGLALAHRVVTEHGGTLAAANSAEGGAVFTLRLPL
ncbi:MAG: PAS domain-containing protein [Acidobacteria bacterium]|nr:PAS domain-containing protein [Acidobacteriota bacterium]MCA1642522.1 PAS domain-containing protein [Acidobacteriota bacterium]